MDGNREADSAASSESERQVSLDALPLHSASLLTVLDEDGIIQYESPAIERIYEYKQDELVGEQVAEYFHPDDREEVLAAFERAVRSEEDAVESIEYRHRTADGTYLWVESIASATPTSNEYYVINTRDISDQKDREQRLEEFASIVSHDLRNPLNVAQARVQLAQDERESDHLAAVTTAHERMETLIDNVLALSRVNKQTGEKESVELGQLCENCWQTISTADATLVTDTDRQLQADPNRLQQLIENLIRNAIEHGGETVTVTVGTTDDGFYVEDDGSGIPAADRDNIFEAGYSTEQDGTGLGLSIVQQIGEAHDWHLRVTDGADDGARFEITNVEFSHERG